MAKSTKDVFAQTMSPEMIEAADLRAKELLDEYDTRQKLREALDLGAYRIDAGQEAGFGCAD